MGTDHSGARHRLSEEFEGIFSPETVEEVLRDSALRQRPRCDSTFQVLTESFARERLLPQRHRQEGRL